MATVDSFNRHVKSRNLSVSDTMPMPLNSDLLYEVILHLRDPRLDASFPLWWVNFDAGLHEGVEFLASLALVSLAWGEPSRRVLLRTTLLILGESQAKAFARLLDNRPYAAPAIRTLLVDFPFRLARMSDFVTAQRLNYIVSQCPNLSDLHLDNVPPSLVSPDFLHGLAAFSNSDGITSFALRCAGPYQLITVPMTVACVPPFTHLSRLALCGVDVSRLHHFNDNSIWSRLSIVHLHGCNVSNSLARHFATSPLEYLHIEHDDLSHEFLAHFFKTAVGSLRQVVIPSYEPIENIPLLEALRPDAYITVNTAPFPYWPELPPKNHFDVDLKYSRRPRYAIGFEVPADTILELSWRLGLLLMNRGMDMPDPFVRLAGMEMRSCDKLSVHAACASYLSTRAQRLLTLIPVDEDIHELPVKRWYICYSVSSLEARHRLKELKEPNLDGGPGVRKVRRLLGCDSPVEEYIFSVP